MTPQQEFNYYLEKAKEYVAEETMKEDTADTDVCFEQSNQKVKLYISGTQKQHDILETLLYDYTKQLVMDCLLNNICTAKYRFCLSAVSIVRDGLEHFDIC